MTNADIVQRNFAAYLAQDQAAADELTSPDLVFTSPQDDHIDKATWLTTCFPTADRVNSQVILHVVEAGPDDVFVMYEYELKTGAVHRNTECLTVRDGLITEIQVFFGGRVH